MQAISQDKLTLVKKLYYGENLSALRVANHLHVSIDAVYYFMRRNGLRRRTMREENVIRYSRRIPSFTPASQLNQRQKGLKIAGSMLYWAEGFQSNTAHHIDFANSKPEMNKLFMRFLRDVCGISEAKLRIYLYCYANQDVEELIRFWCRALDVRRTQFSKPYVRKDFKKEQIGKMKYGLVHIRYYDKKLLEITKEWIDDFVREYI